MDGKERKDRKRISRRNFQPGRVKALSTPPPSDSPPLGLTRIPKQHASYRASPLKT